MFIHSLTQCVEGGYLALAQDGTIIQYAPQFKEELKYSLMAVNQNPKPMIIT